VQTVQIEVAVNESQFIDADPVKANSTPENPLELLEQHIKIS